MSLWQCDGIKVAVGGRGDRGFSGRVSGTESFALAQRNPIKAECRCFLVCTSGSLWRMPEEERKQ